MPATAVISWPSVPVEIVRAAGLRPVIMRGSPAPTEAADTHLEPRIFPSRLRQLVNAALAGRLSDAACVVIPRTSDADYKCFLYLRELVRRGVVRDLPPVILFDLLQSDSAHVRQYDASRTQELVARLGALSGRVPSTDDLRREIAWANSARAAARRLAALRRQPRVTGAEAFPLLAAFWDTPPEEYVSLVDEAAGRIATRAPLRGRRVLLAGAPVDGGSLHAAIESDGAVVVAEAGPFGSEMAGEDVVSDADPIPALADKYRADAAGPRTPRGAIRRWTDRALAGVDAVVVSLPPDDAVYGWDYPALRRQLEERGLPHECLRGDPYELPTHEVSHRG